MTGELILRAVLVAVGALLLAWLAWLSRPRPYNINGGLPEGFAAPVGLILAVALVVVGGVGWFS